MCESCWCGDFSRRISLCLAVVWTAWLWSVRLGGVFWGRDSAVIATQTLPVNFRRHLRVARIVYWLSGDISVVLTLPAPLLQNLPWDPHSRGTSFDTKNETGSRSALFVHLLIAFSVLRTSTIYIHMKFLLEGIRGNSLLHFRYLSSKTQ